MSHKKEVIIVLSICFIASFLVGFILSEIMAVRRMKRESLEGYKAIAIYETNSIGEVKIKTIEWKKP